MKCLALYGKVIFRSLCYSVVITDETKPEDPVSDVEFLWKNVLFPYFIADNSASQVTHETG